MPSNDGFVKRITLPGWLQAKPDSVMAAISNRLLITKKH